MQFLILVALMEVWQKVVVLLLLSGFCASFPVTFTRYALPTCIGRTFGEPQVFQNGECFTGDGGNMAKKLACTSPTADAKWIYHEYFNRGQTFATCDIEPFKTFEGKGDECVHIGKGIYVKVKCGKDLRKKSSPKEDL